MDHLGSYRLRKRLAVGGMGEVYLGEKIGPEGFVKPVVLKCVLPQLSRDRAFVQLFLDEARLAALLNHPNIAQVYDFGLVDDIYYIAMEYVPGYTVDDIRRKLRSINIPMPLEHVACIGTQVCQGLHYAHTLTDANGVGLGLVHRDISPHNLIVSIDGGVKLVDFGIAKARAGLTRVQAKGAVGKFGYMSPEQSRGEAVDGRSDIFSLGVCLWELATNERLHDPKLERAPDYDPAHPLPSVTERRRDVPRQFEQIIETALSIQADDRYPSAQEMHLAVERFLAAMTHYAGQAALSKYIKDLVEGRVEAQGAPSTGGLVGSRSSSGGRSEALDAVQKYEEVFGVTMDAKRNRTRAVPKSWETKRPPSDAPNGNGASPPPRQFDMKARGAGTPAPLELANQEPVGSKRSSSSGRAPAITAGQRRMVPLALVVTLAAIAAIGGVGVAFYGEIRSEIEKLLTPPEAPVPKQMSIYQVISDPPGATVLLDGVEMGVTPRDLELIPGVEYAITVKLPKYAPKTAVVSASVGTEVRPVQFKLEAAATLKVTSEPPGASLSIDGKPVANQVTPMTLDDLRSGQDLRFTAELKGMQAASKTVKLGAGKNRTLHFVLLPAKE